MKNMVTTKLEKQTSSFKRCSFAIILFKSMKKYFYKFLQLYSFIFKVQIELVIALLTNTMMQICCVLTILL